MSGEPYLSDADSALLRSALRRYSGGKCLEIGSGNGGTLIDLGARFETVVGTDLSRPEMADWKDAGVDFVLADLATCFRPSSFDLVAFNPPYLVGRVQDPAVDGGEVLEVPREFLREALRVVRGTGAVVMVLNDEADIHAFEEVCLASGFRLDPIESTRMFFERLTVYAASRAICGQSAR
jgi:methylase of polypeptide subunit release factors